MNVLILGSGGREHALCTKVQQSKAVENVWVSPGNAGTEMTAKNVGLPLKEAKAIRDFIVKENIGLVIIGPEAPLAEGLADQLQAFQELNEVRILGPGKSGARLEGSKSFAKEFMFKYQIPTAQYREFTLDNLEEGISYLKSYPGPYVLKADGLAAGKGVIITENTAEAKKSLSEMLEGQFGEASKKVVVEEFLDGTEFSVFILTDGKNYQLLPEAKDYKRIGEGDTGPNTGGMGSISPVPFFKGELKERVIKEIVEPTLVGLQKEKIPYCGFIFFGLINHGGAPKVIEYNCRLGDPETQAILPRIDSDLVSHIISIIDGKPGEEIQISPNSSAAVIAASKGYPGSVEKGKPISGLEAISDSYLFHAGTKMVGNRIMTNGGRVLAISSLAKTPEEAVAKSYENMNRICYEGITYRKDIGKDILG
ncbi:MAG: phosphoribosylamine--glycine ligase [Saprospirales bacterium]|nr:MAG: phosphoribosylamine--glycine ligase [Saprospirales bacterium]